MSKQSLRFCSLGSGSEGNALVIQADDTTIVVDCGFKSAELLARLQHHAITPQTIDAIFVTHEHADHAAGVAYLARLANAPVYASRGTLAQISNKNIRHIRCMDVQPITLGSLVITPFSVPHDACEPLQYKVAHITKPQNCVGILTDAGHITAHIIEVLQTCSALYLEFNHDPLMLRHSAYHARLKARIAGNYGHLSNQQAVKLLQHLPPQTLLVAAHLSQSNNTPEKVSLLLQTYANETNCRVVIAAQDKGFEWVELQ